MSENTTPENVKSIRSSAPVDELDIVEIDEGDDLIEPLHFRIPGCETVFTAYEPDSGTVMDIEAARDTRQVLSLFIGEDWPAVEDALSGRKPEALIDLATKLSRHFKLSTSQVMGNRQARRRAQRSKR
jgi:hypothetical protein